MCVGDLNDALSDNEKSGGILRTPSQLSWSRQALELYGLADLGFEGYHFTWTNGRQEEANIQCRLDRGLAYASFIS